MRHRYAQRDPTKALPRDRISDLSAQWFEAQAIAVLQEHQTQVRLDRHRWAPEASVKVCPERLEESRIVEQAVNGHELGGHPEAHLGEDRFPQRGLRVYSSQHDGLDPY